PLSAFLFFPAVGPCSVRPVSARLVFFPVCEIYLLSRVCQFCRKDPHVHAYNNSQFVHRIKMIYI
uniref:Uncharacterized protein n=1 Tax=Triticum urartu TaxID=4572 RepID=A0A8R7V2I0_TRIUA